ncbi:HDOD domain-containing protein [Gemmatimonas phototrophica]|uniref:HDOD domain-containing protein n=1 Tax=Gemmatimonas phototrophica TaxID=1379270 RepID=UPI001313F7E5|nr:HDOD domain-containing protein [Gemmatimonas phototrophica]
MPPRAPRRSDEILQAYEASADVSRGSGLVWLARDASYWTDRASRTLHQLREDWSATADTAKWPDVSSVLTQLSAPPEDLIRQLPSTAREAMSLCERENFPRSELVIRLSKDPSLVQALLRQANSASYGAGLSPILRVDAALDRIGLAGTRAVVVSASVDGLLSKPGGVYDGMLANAWQHMVNTGPMARALAPAFGADGEEAFACALLHDVGTLIILDRLASVRTANRRNVALPDGWLELVLAELHEPVGAVAAHRWGLGVDAADAIGTHHRRDTPAEKHPLAETLFVAEHLARAAARGESLDLFGLWEQGELSGDATHARGILDRQLSKA